MESHWDDLGYTCSSHEVGKVVSGPDHSIYVSTQATQHHLDVSTVEAHAVWVGKMSRSGHRHARGDCKSDFVSKTVLAAGLPGYTHTSSELVLVKANT